MPRTDLSHEDLMIWMRELPQPSYPWPLVINPNIEQLHREYEAWIDADYQFHSPAARDRHKSHRFDWFGSWTLPLLSLPELRSITRYATTGAMMDDYYDRTATADWNRIIGRLMALLRGEADEPEPGIEYQWWRMRVDALDAGMPAGLYRRYVASLHDVLRGYRAEKRWVAADQPPPVAVYLALREPTSGAQPFCWYTAMQKDFRHLPDEVFDHPLMRRMHQLCCWLIGIHNDLYSLPKELCRDGDVINLVLSVQHEHRLSLDAAYRKALAIHDHYLEQFLTLTRNLPDFGQCQALVEDYIHHLGIMAKGFLHYHQQTVRYHPESYVEPEFRSPDFRWTRPRAPLSEAADGS
ncbi:terpene synthase family protein [Nocardia brasiliensis]